jgi:general secretion pathway protein I
VSRTRQNDAGFTLLEIMVAVAILSITLVVLISIVTNNVRATQHARLTTTATFLARVKMVDVEDEILYDGFSSDSESDSGTFKDLNYPTYRWESAIDRIELPADLGQRAKDQATDKTQDAKDPMSLITGFMGGMMSSFLDPIRIGLEESVRKVTVRVIWDEPGRPEQVIEVVQYLTDPAKLLTPGVVGGAPGTPGATTPGGTGTPNPLGGALGGGLGGGVKLPGQP